jgi:P27 family predicted phage terminase small subunit
MASADWDRLAAILMERHVLSRADGPILELLVMTYAGWRRAVTALGEDGVATQTGSGSFKVSPELNACDKLGKLLLTLLKECGLTLASRTAVRPIVDIARDQDPWAELIDADPIAAHIRLR